MSDAPSPRERRRQAAGGSKSIGGGIEWKKLAGPVVLLLVIGVIVFAMNARNESFNECPGHWHSTIGVWVEGDRVGFPQGPYELGSGSAAGQMGMGIHMHAPDQETLHYEPVGGAKCVGVQDTFEELDIALAGDSITISGAHQKQGTWTANETHVMQFWITSNRGELKQWAWADVKDRQLLDGEKLVVVFGDETEADIQAYMNAIRDPPSGIVTHG